MTSAEAAAVRRRGLCTPLCALALSAAGWLPPGILVPWLLSEFVQMLPWKVCWHLGLPFAIAGLIGLTYNLLACQFLMLRVAYPRLWVDAQDWRRTAREELRSLERQLRIVPLLPVLVPLIVGAASMASMVAVSTGPVVTPGYLAFQLLVLFLIICGMIGCWLAISISQRLGQTLAALTACEAIEVSRGSTTVLQPGMVFHCSTSIRDPLQAGATCSETVLITDKGCEVLTSLPRELFRR